MKVALIIVLVIAIATALYWFNPVNPTAFIPSERPANNSLGITLPEGFTIEIYADGITGARSMSYNPQKNHLFVGTRDDTVWVLQDGNGDYDATDDMRTDGKNGILRGLNSPNGVAYRNGSLYVAEISRVLRYDNADTIYQSPISSIMYTEEPVVIYDDFPTDNHHGWKFIRFGPDGKLYVPVGAPCNLCDEGEPYATITRMNPDGSDYEVYARGIRNTVGFDWNSGELWFTDNGRDLMGDDTPPDELNHAPVSGMHFGYPYCHGSGIEDDDFTERNCDEFTPAAQELGPHVAALGMRFYSGTMFPEYYRGGIFIAEHGSWNRRDPIGYRITFVKLENNKPVSYETFAEGWLTADGAWGRPVDVEILPDGSMLVSDDKAGAIYRIMYTGQ